MNIATNCHSSIMCHRRSANAGRMSMLPWPPSATIQRPTSDLLLQSSQSATTSQIAFLHSQPSSSTISQYCYYNYYCARLAFLRSFVSRVALRMFSAIQYRMWLPRLITVAVVASARNSATVPPPHHAYGSSYFSLSNSFSRGVFQTNTTTAGSKTTVPANSALQPSLEIILAPPSRPPQSHVVQNTSRKVQRTSDHPVSLSSPASAPETVLLSTEEKSLPTSETVRVPAVEVVTIATTTKTATMVTSRASTSENVAAHAASCLQQHMTLFVRTMTGKTITLRDVPRNLSIDAFREVVAAREGGPPEQVRLIYAGKQLQSLLEPTLFCVPNTASRMVQSGRDGVNMHTSSVTETTLESYRIPPMATLHLVQCMEGG